MGTSSPFSLGALSYVNSLPFFFPISKKKIASPLTMRFGMPEEINQLIEQGVLQAGLISSGYFIEQKEHLLPLVNFGIAAEDAVLSVRLYFKNSLQDLRGKKIYVPTCSKSSIHLLKILCREFWHIDTTLVPTQSLNTTIKEISGMESFLLIGDICLKHLEITGFSSVDLGTSWHDATKLGFVFALFAVRKEFALSFPQEIAYLQNSLESAYNWSVYHRESIIEEAFIQTKINKNILQRYYETLSFRLTSSQMSGLSLFESLYKNGVANATI